MSLLGPSRRNSLIANLQNKLKSLMCTLENGITKDSTDTFTQFGETTQRKSFQQNQLITFKMQSSTHQNGTMTTGKNLMITVSPSHALDSSADLPTMAAFPKSATTLFGSLMIIEMNGNLPSHLALSSNQPQEASIQSKAIMSSGMDPAETTT